MNREEFEKRLIEELREFASKITQSGDRVGEERGGVIKLVRQGVVVEELANHATSSRELIIFVDEEHLGDDTVAGFWHTHSKRPVPSPWDLVQMIFLNVTCRKAFYLAVLHEKGVRLLSFSCLVIPRSRFEVFN